MIATEPKSSTTSLLQSKSGAAPFFQPEESRQGLFGPVPNPEPFFKPTPPAANTRKPASVQRKLFAGTEEDLDSQESIAIPDDTTRQRMDFPAAGSKDSQTISNQIQFKPTDDVRIQRQEFGEQVRMNSLDGEPPRAQLLATLTDEAIALELYGNARIPIVVDQSSTMTIFVDYSRLRPERRAFFTPSDQTTMDFLLTQTGTLGAGRSRTSIRQRRQTALALADLARAEITDTNLIDAYLQRTDLSNEEKAATLGQLVVLHGKVEFLLGWIYEGGIQDPDRSGFENTRANTGDFPNLYQQSGGGSEAGGGNEWCTSFAGYLYQTLGLIPGNIIRSNVFLSGYRLRHWATTGQDNNSHQITPQGERLESSAEAADNGTALIDREAWRGLRTSLRHKSPAECSALVDTFLENHAVPQAGDIVVIGGENNTFQEEGHSHTVIVERYDSTTHTITTIEGNANGLVRGNNGISSRMLNLTDREQLGQFIMLARPGVQFANTPAGAPAIQVDDFELIRPIAAVIATLVAFAAAPERRWICSDDSNASIQEWMNGPLCAAH